jgi:hypothetical protein
MMKLFMLLLLCTLANATRLMKYNTKYSISKPHYLQKIANIPKPLPIKSVPNDIEIDYEIPKWVYRKVFAHNKKYTFKK